jgi:hypothetical protein
MYKLNVALMVVLSIAVVATGALLAIERDPAGAPQDAQVKKLIRQLADSDPDVRRDAEAALKRLGPTAVPALKAAAGGQDELLAGRAKQVINQIEGAPVVRKPDAPQPPSHEDIAPPTVEAALSLVADRVASGAPLRFYLRFRNGTPQSVLLARHRVEGIVFYGQFAAFEITDADGTVTTIPVDAFPRDAEPELDVFAVPAGQVADLFAGRTGQLFASALSKPGVYKVRFVYDATEKSAYRDAIARAHSAEGVPLPPGRVSSNAVALTVE